MIDLEKYISVLDYATIKGISKQAVYKQLNGKLKDFYIVVDGRKYIDRAVLSDADNQRFNKNNQPNNQPTTNLIQPLLENQIAEKDKTIDRLLNQIEELQEQNKRLTDLLANSQTLMAVDKKILLEQETSSKTKKSAFFGIFGRKTKEN